MVVKCSAIELLRVTHPCKLVYTWSIKLEGYPTPICVWVCIIPIASCILCQWGDLVCFAYTKLKTSNHSHHGPM